MHLCRAGLSLPDTGGEYTLLGRTLGPIAGFAILGLLLTGFTLGDALSDGRLGFLVSGAVIVVSALLYHGEPRGLGVSRAGGATP